MAATPEGLCSVTLSDTPEEAESALRRAFPHATITRDDAALAPVLQTLLDHLAGTRPYLDFSLDVQATAFQQRVWAALREIPAGETRTYGEVAALLGQPAATRAVARACATNPVALVVPCHRVVRSDGGLSGYRWGVERKAWLLKAEAESLTSVCPVHLLAPHERPQHTYLGEGFGGRLEEVG